MKLGAQDGGTDTPLNMQGLPIDAAKDRERAQFSKVEVALKTAGAPLILETGLEEGRRTGNR